MALRELEHTPPVDDISARRYGRPLYWAIFGLPLWWALGFDAFIWPILAVPMLLMLLKRPEVRVPRGFGVWILFLGWILVSATQLDHPLRSYIFIWRLSLYFAATVFFIYVYNAPKGFGSEKLLLILGGLWAMIVLGGFLGMAFPTVGWHTIAEKIMPGGFVGNKWVHDLLHVRFSQVQTFVEGSPLVRPSVFFPYSNDWGASFSLLVPFGLAIAGRKRNPWMVLLLAASIIPLIGSSNRGAWFSLGMGLAYAAWRLATRGRATPLVSLTIAALIAGSLLIATPLGDFLETRTQHPQSNETRFGLYEEATQQIMGSPIVGYGAPRPSARNADLHVGTHGQFWLVLFSHGIPGAILFMGFFLLTLWRTRASPTRIGFWANVAVLIALLQLPYYILLPSEIIFLMMAAALAWREVAPPAEPVPA